MSIPFRLYCAYISVTVLVRFCFSPKSASQTPPVLAQIYVDYVSVIFRLHFGYGFSYGFDSAPNYRRGPPLPSCLSGGFLLWHCFQRSSFSLEKKIHQLFIESTSPPATPLLLRTLPYPHPCCCHCCVPVDSSQADQIVSSYGRDERYTVARLQPSPPAPCGFCLALTVEPASSGPFCQCLVYTGFASDVGGVAAHRGGTGRDSARRAHF